MYAPTKSRYHRDPASSIFLAAGVNPRFVQYARETHTMLALVAATAGVMGGAGASLQPITLAPPVFSELTMAWRERYDNPAIRLFTEAMLPRFLRERA